jgi:hypothetical protein
MGYFPGTRLTEKKKVFKDIDLLALHRLNPLIRFLKNGSTRKDDLSSVKISAPIIKLFFAAVCGHLPE